jgi:hypothetical protein
MSCADKQKLPFFQTIIVLIFSVLVLCTQVNMMFVMLL